MTPDDRTWSFTHWKPKHWLDSAASISSKILGFDSAPLGDIGSLTSIFQPVRKVCAEMLLHNSIWGVDHYRRVSKQKKWNSTALFCPPPPSPSIGVGILTNIAGYTPATVQETLIHHFFGRTVGSLSGRARQPVATITASGTTNAHQPAQPHRHTPTTAQPTHRTKWRRLQPQHRIPRQQQWKQHPFHQFHQLHTSTGHPDRKQSSATTATATTRTIQNSQHCPERSNHETCTAQPGPYWLLRHHANEIEREPSHLPRHHSSSGGGSKKFQPGANHCSSHGWWIHPCLDPLAPPAPHASVPAAWHTHLA